MDPTNLAALEDLLPDLLIGLLFLILSLLLLLGSMFSWRKRDYSLLYFGILALVFGVRLLLTELPGRQLFGWDPQAINYVRAALQYSQLVTVILFLEQIIGPGWRRSIRRLWQVAIPWSVGCLIRDLVLQQPGASEDIEAIYMILTQGVILAHFFIPGNRSLFDQKFLLSIYLLGSAFIFNDFLVQHGWVSWSWTLQRPGLLAVLIIISYLLFNRVLGNRAHMLAVREELDLARDIQRSILPQTQPKIDGLALTTRFIPMTSVAGDFYDIRKINTHTLGVLVADVSGHGIPAALVSSMVKVAFNAQDDHLEDPAALLEGINTSFEGTLDRQFLTGTYIVLDRASGVLTCAGAAHPPVLIWRAASRDVQDIRADGLLIGLFPTVGATNQTYKVAPGDRVILYTDGFSEAMNSKEEDYGLVRLEKFLIDYAHLDGQAFADTLMQDIRRWMGADAAAEGFDDDMTLVVVDVTTTVEEIS